MAPFTVQTLFLFYSALSLSSAVLIGMLFWKKKDISAYLWFSACVLTSTATAVTVYRNEIPMVISYSLMVALETFSILLFGRVLNFV